MEVKKEAKKPAKGLFILLPIFIILTVAAFVFAFSVNTEVQKYKKLFEKEMAFRLDMEEKVNQFRSEKIEMSSVIDDKDAQIKEKNAKIDELNKAIDAKDVEIKSLKLTIEKVNSLTKQAEQNKGSQGSTPIQQNESE